MKTNSEWSKRWLAKARASSTPTQELTPSTGDTTPKAEHNPLSDDMNTSIPLASEESRKRNLEAMKEPEFNSEEF